MAAKKIMPENSLTCAAPSVNPEIARFSSVRMDLATSMLTPIIVLHRADQAFDILLAELERIVDRSRGKGQQIPKGVSQADLAYRKIFAHHDHPMSKGYSLTVHASQY